LRGRVARVHTSMVTGHVSKAARIASPDAVVGQR
jgi:hypothetical protein